MNRVFVLDTNLKALAPCTPRRARILMSTGKAAAYRYNPFTIVLKRAVADDATTKFSIRIDPGSVVTGMCIIGHFPKQGDVAIFAAEITHKGKQIKAALHVRKVYRQSRRAKLRHREWRYFNRKNRVGKIPPSQQSTVDNITHFVSKFNRLVSNIVCCDVEVSIFNIQKMMNPAISKSQYATGELYGFSSIREYLIHRDGKMCQYCGATGGKLQIDHVIPRAFGNNSVSNLVLACKTCNNEKTNKPIAEFLKTKPSKLKQITSRFHLGLSAASKMNVIRNKLITQINAIQLPSKLYTGYQTEHNRTNLGYQKEHWIDAACVGDNTHVHIPHNMIPLRIKAIGRGYRRVVKSDSYGFPRINQKTGKTVAASLVKRVHGFSTGDYVKLSQPRGKYTGEYVGRMCGIRANGNFVVRVKESFLVEINGKMKTMNTVDGNYRNFTLLQHGDGYEYS